MPIYFRYLITGEYPEARIDFNDETFPASVALNVFNPLISRQEDDSSLPAVQFETAITDNTEPAGRFVLRA